MFSARVRSISLFSTTQTGCHGNDSDIALTLLHQIDASGRGLMGKRQARKGGGCSESCGGFSALLLAGTTMCYDRLDAVIQPPDSPLHHPMAFLVITSYRCLYSYDHLHVLKRIRHIASLKPTVSILPRTKYSSAPRAAWTPPWEKAGR